MDRPGRASSDGFCVLFGADPVQTAADPAPCLKPIWADRLFGREGDGVIDGLDPGRPDGDRVNGGTGVDRAIVDPSTEDIVAANCENVTVG